MQPECFLENREKRVNKVFDLLPNHVYVGADFEVFFVLSKNCYRGYETIKYFNAVHSYQIICGKILEYVKRF